MLIFDGTADFLYSQSLPLPGAYLGKNAPQCPTSNTQKMTKNGPIWAKNGQKRKFRNHLYRPKIEKWLHLTFFNFSKLCTVSEIWPFKVEIPVRIYSSSSIELTKNANTWSLTAVTYIWVNFPKFKRFFSCPSSFRPTLLSCPWHNRLTLGIQTDNPIYLYNLEDLR